MQTWNKFKIFWLLVNAYKKPFWFNNRYIVNTINYNYLISNFCFEQAYNCKHISVTTQTSSCCIFSFVLFHFFSKLIFLGLKLASFYFLFTIQFNFSRIALDQEEKNIILHLFKYMPFSSSCSIEVGTTQIFIPRISAFFLNLPKSHKNMPNFISCIECFFCFTRRNWVEFFVTTSNCIKATIEFLSLVYENMNLAQRTYITLK